MIKRVRQKTIVLLALTLSCLSAIPAASKPIQIGARSNVNTIQGRSGGNINSRGCGFISKQPSQVINVTERINYMKVSVSSSAGQATLLIEGPNGRLCSIKPNPEIAGVWVPGSYSIYVGDRTNARHPYTLSITPKK